MRPRILDLFCGAGGAGMGYHRAGFDVVGVDISPQPRYPFKFIQADAVETPADYLASFDAIHASPPCQAHTRAQRLMGNEHPDLIEPVREMLEASGRPYVIENVPGAPLLNPLMLCGAMFSGLRVYRHRMFECNFFVLTPPHPVHDEPQVKMGRKPNEGDFIQVVGNFSGVEYARRAMDIDWMGQKELAQSIPPAFTEYLGRELLGLISERAAA